MKRRLLSLLLAVSLLLCLLPLEAAGAEEIPDRDYDGIPDAYDLAPEDNVFTGKMKSGHDGTTTVSFTMDFRCFFGDNSVYSPTLASSSVIGSALAYCLPNYGDAYFVFDTPQTWAGGTASKVDGPQLMALLGFEDVADYKLNEVYSDDDICEVILGHRTVSYNGQTKVILALWVRGTARDSQEEWSSNFHMGDLARFFEAYDSVEGKSPRQSNEDWTRKTNHRGFDVCATRILKHLGGYHSQYVQPVLESVPEAELVYWITGHSRGASVGNLMASYLIDRGEKVFTDLSADRVIPLEDGFWDRMVDQITLDEAIQFIEKAGDEKVFSTARSVATLEALMAAIQTPLVKNKKRIDTPPSGMANFSKTGDDAAAKGARALDTLTIMLDRLDKNSQKAVFESMEATNPELVGKIKKLMFVFGDIVNLNDMEIQAFIREADTKDLTVSLKAASAEVQERIFNNMSSRQKEMIQSDMQYLHNLRMRDVEAAQQRIIDVIRGLEESGDIVLFKGGDDEIIA